MMPGVDDFRWSHQSFSGGAEGLGAAHSLLIGELEALEAELHGTIANWVGPARQSYDIAQAEWRSSANNITDNLRAANVTVENTYDTYQGMERQAMGLFERGGGNTLY